MAFRKRQKYNAKKTWCDGILFDSKKEAARYPVLKLLEKAGAIKDLKLQPKFKIVIEKTYKADFQYVEVETNEIIIEDVKGFKTREYITKRKYFRKQYPHLKHLET